MGFLFLSILCGTAIVVIFRLIDLWKVNKLEAIIINYLVAFLTGLMINIKDLSSFHIPSSGWIVAALVIGVLFVVMFYVLGLTVAGTGISIATIAAKMSVAIPILFSIVAYGESVTLLKISGITLAVISLALVLYTGTGLPDRKVLLFPVLLFLGMGMVDTTVKIAQQQFVSPGDLLSFSTILFLVSFLTSILARTGSKPFFFRFHRKLLVTGILLGLVNLGSLYFFISALESGFRDSSLIFGMNNIGIVSLSVFTGIVFFREKLNRINWIGIFIALISLYLLYTA
ncbi:MAG: DMT family transporter [Chlorobi bacterium]|nr:DMT family transporter [Chlorobiota bacterium]